MHLSSKNKEKLNKTKERLDAPFYFYDLDHLKSHLTYMRDNSHPRLKLWYACKANPMSAILKVFRNLNFGIDVASQGEIDQALRAGILSSEMITTGPAKSKEYMKSLLQNEVQTIVLESLNQAYWLNEVAKDLGRTPDTLLRVQLPWEKGESVLGGDSITPFGIEPSQWLKLDKSRCNNLNIKGFHVFQWGNILEMDRLEKIWRAIIETVSELSTSMNIPLDVLDLGGGLGIPYSQNESSLDFKDVNKLLSRLIKDYSLNSIWMELGRFAIGESGHYLCKIVDRKHVRGREILVLEGGINHLCRPAITNQPFPCELFRESSSDKIDFQVHGPLCTALDTLGHFKLPADTNIGDWLVFNQAGAYGFTEAMPFFLCHQLPAEVIIYNDSVMVPRPNKTSADWMI